MTKEKPKRLFFGIEVFSPWPDHFPKGRLLEEKNRHLTLVFLGDTLLSRVEEICQKISCDRWISIGGVFDHLLLLPPHHPNVVAWHIDFLEDTTPLFNLQHQIIDLLNEYQIPFKNQKRDFLPHLTLARSPFNEVKWEESFKPLPLFLGDLHLYESLGYSKYQSLWSLPILKPFDEIEHQADLAFLVRGKDLEKLFIHAILALSFHCPPFLNYLNKKKKVDGLDGIIMELNEMIMEMDKERGSPFKAVSFHGSNVKEKETYLEWEMIIDV